jgi:uncharacterized protein (TIGR02147 family)
MSVFEYLDYKAFLAAQLKAHRRERGYQAKMAKAASCNSSYLSSVVRGSNHLTPDHADGLCRFWHFSDLESGYFLTLVHLARAASKGLRERLQKQAATLRKQQERLDQRLGRTQAEMAIEQAARYYSAWYFSAIHFLVGIPRFQSPRAIAERLQLSMDLVHATLASLAEMGLVRREAEHWARTEHNLHLSQDSSMAAIGHTHWRQRSVMRFPEETERGLFYSGLHTLSAEEFRQVKELLTNSLARTREIVGESKDEELYCLNCDWFRV